MLPAEEFLGRLLPILEKNCGKALEELVQRRVDPRSHQALYIHFLDLYDDVELAGCFSERPRQFLDLWEDTMAQHPHGFLMLQASVIQRLCPEAPAPPNPEQPPYRDHLKRRVHLRIKFRAPDHTLQTAVSKVGAAHINNLICIQGTVVRTGQVKMYKDLQGFVCSKCKGVTWSACKLDEGGVAPPPTECGHTPGCVGGRFGYSEDHVQFTGFQEVKVQEKNSCLAMGALPASLPVILKDDLVDTLQCGDDVDIWGIVTPRWEPFFPGQQCKAELVMFAHVVEVNSSRRGVQLSLAPGDTERFQAFWASHRNRPLAARDFILSAICPQIHGMFLVKLAVALSLVGGVSRPNHDRRGLVHLLLIGDPGIGKSQIMKFAARAAQRSVTASGKAATGAGLTAAAVKDGQTWTLDAGALVLADGGICCIDEFDGIRETDRPMVHEAMEQQSVHVAKAGIITTLATRTTVIAAVNPKPGWKHTQPLKDATNLSGPLLSRFDIILLLLDERHPARDKAVAERVLDNHQQGAPAGPASGQGRGSGMTDVTTTTHGAHAPAGREPRHPEPGGALVPVSDTLPPPLTLTTQQVEGTWELETLKRYLVWVKTGFSPSATDEAEKVISAYYNAIRQADERQQAMTTVRCLEGLVRTAQAHAKLCARQCVTRQDAVVAVILADSSLKVLHVFGTEAPLSSSFAEDPDKQYQELEKRVLDALGLPRVQQDPIYMGRQGWDFNQHMAEQPDRQTPWGQLGRALAPNRLRAEQLAAEADGRAAATLPSSAQVPQVNSGALSGGFAPYGGRGTMSVEETLRSLGVGSGRATADGRTWSFPENGPRVTQAEPSFSYDGTTAGPASGVSVTQGQGPLQRMSGSMAAQSGKAHGIAHTDPAGVAMRGRSQAGVIGVVLPGQMQQPMWPLSAPDALQSSQGSGSDLR